MVLFQPTFRLMLVSLSLVLLVGTPVLADANHGAAHADNAIRRHAARAGRLSKRFPPASSSDAHAASLDTRAGHHHDRYGTYGLTSDELDQLLAEEALQDSGSFDDSTTSSSRHHRFRTRTSARSQETDSATNARSSDLPTTTTSHSASRTSSSSSPANTADAESKSSSTSAHRSSSLSSSASADGDDASSSSSSSHSTHATPTSSTSDSASAPASTATASSSATSSSSSSSAGDSNTVASNSSTDGLGDLLGGLLGASSTSSSSVSRETADSSSDSPSATSSSRTPAATSSSASSDGQGSSSDDDDSPSTSKQSQSSQPDFFGFTSSPTRTSARISSTSAPTGLLQGLLPVVGSSSSASSSADASTADSSPTPAPSSSNSGSGSGSNANSDSDTDSNTGSSKDTTTKSGGLFSSLWGGGGFSSDDASPSSSSQGSTPTSSADGSNSNGDGSTISVSSGTNSASSTNDGTGSSTATSGSSSAVTTAPSSTSQASQSVPTGSGSTSAGTGSSSDGGSPSGSSGVPSSSASSSGAASSSVSSAPSSNASHASSAPASASTSSTSNPYWYANTQSLKLAPSTTSSSASSTQTGSQSSDNYDGNTDSGTSTASSSDGTGNGPATQDLPTTIVPSTSSYDQPANTTSIGVLFKEDMQWTWVISQADLTAQIFAFMPDLVGQPAGLETSKVSTVKLASYSPDSNDTATTETLSTARTLYMAYVPTSSVEDIQALIANTSSPFYTTAASGAPQQLASQVDPTFNILSVAGIVASGAKQNAKTSSGETTDTPKLRNSLIGVGCGLAGAFAVVAGGLIWRNKRKGQDDVGADGKNGGISRAHTIRSFHGGLRETWAPGALDQHQGFNANGEMQQVWSPHGDMAMGHPSQPGYSHGDGFGGYVASDPFHDAAAGGAAGGYVNMNRSSRMTERSAYSDLSQMTEAQRIQYDYESSRRSYHSTSDQSGSHGSHSEHSADSNAGMLSTYQEDYRVPRQHTREHAFGVRSNSIHRTRRRGSVASSTIGRPEMMSNSVLL